jgi:hypothetical protein
MSIMICDIWHVNGGGHMASDPRASLLVVTRGNGSLKLEGFLKHNHFACNPTHSHINKKNNILEYKYLKH